MTTNTEALPYTSERHFALRDAHTIAAGDAYFEVRPHLTAFGPHRLTFDAGFVRGFDKATELADERAVAELRRLSAVEAERDALRAALVRARGDINWMLNTGQFLNPEVFDYLDAAMKGTQ